MYKIGWFSTGRGQGSLNLLNSIMKAINDKTVNDKLLLKTNRRISNKNIII